MDLDELRKMKRNPDLIKSYFTVGADNVVTKENIMIMFPKRYITRGLCILDNIVNVIGVYAIIDNYNNYCVVNTPIIQSLSPSMLSNTNIGGIDYKLLFFNKNDVFLTTNNLIVKDNIIYPLMEEFYMQGKIPWFLDYDDLCGLLLESKKYTGSGIGNDPLVFEIMTSIVGRSPADRTIFYRTVRDKYKNPYYIGLNNPFYSYGNTGAKLIGNRFGTGINTALINKETKSSVTTDILRR